MTVNTTNITSGPYSGNDVAASFSYTFRVDSDTHASVWETDAAGVETLLTLNTHYTVAGVGNDGGGLITRVAGALPTGYTWYIRANYPDTQLTAFSSQGGFQPGVHENAFDKLTFIIQQIQDRLKRSIRLGDSDSSAELANMILDSLTDRKGKYLAFDAAGNPTAVTSAVGVLPSSTVSDVVTLRAAVVVNESLIYMQYHTTPGDGGHGSFRGVTGAAPSTYVDNGGTIIVPTGGDGSAAFLRVYTGDLDPRMFGARGDGITDDTAALTSAAATGRLFLPKGTFFIDNLSVGYDIYGPGTLKRRAGGGAFLATSSTNITIECEVDANNIGSNAINIIHDNVVIGVHSIVRNSAANGVDVRDCNNASVYGKYYDCVQTHVLVKAATQDMTGVVIDVHVDGTALGTSQANGGVKVQGTTGTFKVIQPKINAVVFLAEDASMPLNAVCIETSLNVEQPIINGVVFGGSIGCTLGGSPGGVARVIAKGQHTIGLEISSASHGASYTNSSSTAGMTVAPTYNFQASGSDRVSAEFYGSGVNDATSGFCFYLDNCQGARVTATMDATAAKSFVRLINSSDLDITVQGTGTAAQGLNLVGTCDDIRINGGEFTGLTNFIQGATTFNRVSVSGGCRIKNTGAFVGGGALMPAMTISPDCVVDTHNYGTGAKNVEIVDYVSQAGPHIMHLIKTGTPEGVITAGIGSTCTRDDGAAGTTFYVKESGTGATGWVAK